MGHNLNTTLNTLTPALTPDLSSLQLHNHEMKQSEVLLWPQFHFRWWEGGVGFLPGRRLVTALDRAPKW